VTLRFVYWSTSTFSVVTVTEIETETAVFVQYRTEQKPRF